MKKSIRAATTALLMCMIACPLAPLGASGAEGDFGVTHGGQETRYQSIENAVSKLVDGDTLTLYADATVDAESIKISEQGITVNGKGHTVSVTSERESIRAFDFEKNSSVNVKDLNIKCTDKATGAYAIIAREGADVTLEGVNIEYEGADYAISAINAHSLNIISSSVVSRVSSKDCIYFSSSGALGVKDSKIVSASTCALRVTSGGTLCIEGGYVANHMSYNHTVLLEGADSVTVCDGYISNGGDKYAIYSATDTVSNLYGGHFVNKNGQNAVSINGAACSVSTKAPTLVEGAAVRLPSSGQENGIRFESRISKEAYESLNGMSATYGTLICPTDYLYGNDLTSISLSAMKALDLPVVNIVADNGLSRNTDGTYTVRASLVDLKTYNYSRAFSAVSYVSYKIGEKTVYAYSPYEAEKNSRSITEVAKAALSDQIYSYTESQKNVLLNYISVGASVLGTPLADFKLELANNADFNATRFAAYLDAYLQSVTGKRLSENPDASKTLLIGQLDGISLSDHEYAVSITESGIQASAASSYAYEAMLEYFECEGISELSAANTQGILKRQSITPSLSRLERADSSALRIMYHNVWGWEINGVTNNPTQRIEMLADLYKSYSPDVLCFAEVTANMMRSELASKLAALGYSETANNKVGSAETATPIFYKSDKFTERASGVEKLDGDDKFITWAVLTEKATENTFAVISAHLEYRSGESYDTVRKEQALKLVEKADALSKNYACSAFVGGDMNSRTESDAYKAIVAAGYKDTNSAPITEDVGTTYGYPRFNQALGYHESANGVLPTYSSNAIDHVLCKGEALTLLRYDVVTDTYALAASDHAPTLIDFSIEREYTKNY